MHGPELPSHAERRGALCLLASALLLGVGAPLPAARSETAPPRSWNLSLRGTTYAWQTDDGAGASADNVRFDQHFAAGASGLAGGRLALRASGRFARLPDAAWPGTATSRLTSAYLETRLARGLRARVGRQFLQGGVTSLTLDGAELVARRGSRVEASAWGGARAPWQHDFAAGALDREAAAGARLAFTPARGHRLVVSGAYRERDGRVAARPIGCEVATTALPRVDLLARAAYDLATDRWSRLEGQLRWQPAPARPVLGLQFVDRAPAVDAASWFARLGGLERVRLARASVTWESRARFGGEAEGFASRVGDRTSTRLGLALLLPAGRVGWSLRDGDTGQESSLYGELAWQARRWLRLEGEASRLVYALVADAPAADERELTTLAARARVRLRPGCDVTAEVQRLETPLYAHDVRALVGLDLSLARGATRTGLDRGGWPR